MSEYDKPLELYDGLRLHQNENTIGCSPRVLAALAALRLQGDTRVRLTLSILTFVNPFVRDLLKNCLAWSA